MIKNISFTLFLMLFTLSCGGGGSSSETSPITKPVIALEQIKSPMHKSSIATLFILVSYNDVSIRSTQNDWNTKIFGTNAKELNKYYQEVSNGQFQLHPVSETSSPLNNGIISVSLNKNHPNVNINHPNFSSLFYPDFKTILELADSSIDFSNYDDNADGAISFDELALVFIIAGYEDSFEGYHVDKGVWAHNACLSSSIAQINLDGVELLNCNTKGSFSIFGEKHNKSAPHDATIGIIAHELGHAIFNLPDLYNTFFANSGGIGYFGLMGSGMWTKENDTEFPGATPIHFSAWSKIYNRWIVPQENIYGATTLDETTSSSYNVIKISIDANHYYLLENRPNNGFDKGLQETAGNFNGGIAIWEINEEQLRQSNFDNNSVNNITKNKGVDLVEAIDGNIDITGGGGNQNALYYEGNKNYFLNLVDQISPRASTMTLNIR